MPELMSEEYLRETFKNNFIVYADSVLNIKTKESEIIPFKLNRAQKYIHERLEEQKRKFGRVRALILKGRQQGCSTYVGARFYHRIIHSMNTEAYVMAHNAPTTGELFKMSLLFYEASPDQLKPSCSQKSQKKLVFDKINCGYTIGTAGNTNVGRGLTLNLVHGSEVAYWPDGASIAQGLLQAVPDMDGTEIILESTSAGMNNYFYQQWVRASSGDSDFIPIFVPWHWQDEYKRIPDKDFNLTAYEKELKSEYNVSDDQICWRRFKIAEMSSDGSDGEWNFKQVYPFNAIEAFSTNSGDSFIKENHILRARKNYIEAKESDKIIVGVDPAPTGDHCAIVFRQGNKAYGLKRLRGVGSMEMAGILMKTLDTYPNIYMIYIDYAFGLATFERMEELGYGNKICPVQFGSGAHDDEKYLNKRAEMYGRIREWLNNEDVQIPDDDMLHADLSCQMQKIGSERKIQLVAKDIIKKKIGRSPDSGDALALTFADDHFDLSALVY